MLTESNRKLGRVHGWGLPAVASCPGRSTVCERECYALRNHYGRPSVKDALRRNMILARSPEFGDLMTGEVKRRKCKVVRIHTSGDFFDQGYTSMWGDVALACPRTRFYTYTRSWRVGAVAVELVRLAARPNVRLWYSADRETGLPAEPPPGVRVAWLQDAHEPPPGPVSLVFRVTRLRSRPAKRVGLSLVCPVESGAGRAPTCQTCRYCWK